MSEETKILKPQAPLMRGSDYVLPLTSADQVMLANGTRLEKDGKIIADYVSGLSGEWITMNVPADGWTQQEDGRWTQTIEVIGVTADTRGRYADVDMSNASTETYTVINDAWFAVGSVDTVDGGIMLTAFKRKPEIDLVVNVEVLV